jgi:hypothetical protein
MHEPLDGSFCLEMVDEALSRGRPEVFNTDQGVQFTAQAWAGRLESAGVAVSMDRAPGRISWQGYGSTGRGRPERHDAHARRRVGPYENQKPLVSHVTADQARTYTRRMSRRIRSYRRWRLATRLAQAHHSDARYQVGRTTYNRLRQSASGSGFSPLPAVPINAPRVRVGG